LPHFKRRKADIVFTRVHVAVFIDGCFWHSCPRHGTVPVTHAEYWGHKLLRNQERDRETDQVLAAAGWSVLRFWEHEPAEEAAAKIESVVRGR
jgi:DNA mismatch endonuclease (patch repair protein)